VRDKAGAVVPNATVKANNSETGAERTVQSDAEGSYNILALPPGSYEITLISGNFAPFTQKAAVTGLRHRLIPELLLFTPEKNIEDEPQSICLLVGTDAGGV
jgi:hypothetical protein